MARGFVGQAGLSPATERTHFRDKYSLEEKNYDETTRFSEKVDLLSCWVKLPMQDTGLSMGARVSGTACARVCCPEDLFPS